MAERRNERENISSGGKFEPIIGYSRAVRAGDWVHVAGSTAADNSGAIIGIGDAYAQTVQTLKTIAAALAKAGASIDDVVRTRMFVTDISRWQEYGRAHGEVFRTVLPAATMVEVKALVDPDMLIEIEVDAFSPRR